MCRLRANFGRLAHSMQNARNVRREGNPVTLTSYSSPERAIPQPSAAKPLSNLRTLRPEGPVNLKNLFSNDAPILRRLTAPPPFWGRRLWLFVTRHWRSKGKFRNAGFMLIARRAIPQPFEPFEPLVHPYFTLPSSFPFAKIKATGFTYI